MLRLKKFQMDFCLDTVNRTRVMLRTRQEGTRTRGGRRVFLAFRNYSVTLNSKKTETIPRHNWPQD